MKEILLKGLDEKIYFDTCDNGLKVYMWVNRRVNSFYGTLSVKYGSIYNHFKIGSKSYKTPIGIAHFLEHVKFNEDENKTAHDFFNKLGSDTNAFTTFNYTNYQVFGSDNPKENILHLLDFVQNGYFTKKIVNSEKGIIIEESKMDEDNPYTLMLFSHLKSIFHSSEYRNLITGSKEDIQKITLEDIKLIFDAFYHPENMFLIVTGNFNPYELMSAVKDNQNKKKFSKYKNPVRIIKKEKKSINQKYLETNINVMNRKIKIGYKIPKNSLKGYDELHLRLIMAMILKANFGTTSEFKNDLLEKELISNISYMCDIFDDYLVIMFTIDSDYKEEIVKLFREKITNLKVEIKTFERIKKANIASLILEYEDVEMVNGILQTEILNYNGVIDNLKELYENIAVDDVNNLIKLLDFTNESIIVFDPLN